MFPRPMLASPAFKPFMEAAGIEPAQDSPGRCVGRQSVPALWTKHRSLARAIARDYWLPGSERQDVEQEALIGLWIAARAWTPERGASFSGFARLVVKRRLATLLQAALREKHAILTDASREDVLLVDGPDVELVVVAREALARLVAAVADLTPLERDGLVAAVNGEAQGTLLENAAYRARRKLKAAA